MTGAELKAIRQELGLSVVEFGRAIGWTGRRRTIQTNLRKIEGGKRPVDAELEAKVVKLIRR